ncbi:MAG: cation-transporting P-type ATPase, partial [bacterium]
MASPAKEKKDPGMRAIRSSSEAKQREYPWTYTGEEILRDLNSSTERGLATAEVKARQKKYGRNLLREPDKKGSLKILANQFKSLIIGLLVVASLLSFFFKDWMEGIAIIAVIFINTAIGFFTEIKAVRSMEALRRLSRVTTVVRRDAQVQQVLAEELVPGDIVLLDSGDIVSADLRLVE